MARRVGKVSRAKVQKTMYEYGRDVLGLSITGAMGAATSGVSKVLCSGVMCWAAPKIAITPWGKIINWGWALLNLADGITEIFIPPRGILP